MNDTENTKNAAGTAIMQQKRVVGRPFKKGQSGNPSGKKKGTIDFITDLKSAIKKVEKEKGISLIEYAVSKAYTNPQVLIALLKKIIPDITKSESDVKITPGYEEYEKMTDEELIRELEQDLDRCRAIIANNSKENYRTDF